MRTREKKKVFQTKIFKGIKFLNDEYIKYMADHFLPCLLFNSCIYRVSETMVKP